MAKKPRASDVPSRRDVDVESRRNQHPRGQTQNASHLRPFRHNSSSRESGRMYSPTSTSGTSPRRAARWCR